jgi:hypothetical protein
MVEIDGSPKTIEVGLGILGTLMGADDYGLILAYATKYANDKGAKAEDGSEVYDYAKAVATIAIACLDSESDPSHPIPFFGASDKPTFEERVSDVLSNKAIGRDTIMFLAECQDVWQCECSPQAGSGEMTPEEYYKLIAEVAAEGPLAFLRLNAATRLKFLHFMAALLVTLPTLSTTSGNTSG